MNFLYRFSKKKNTQILNLMKIHFVAAELFNVEGRTDGQTNITKQTIAFRNFTNSPNDRFCVFRVDGKMILLICPH